MAQSANRIEEEMKRFEAEISCSIKTETSQFNDNVHETVITPSAFSIRPLPDQPVQVGIIQSLPTRKFLGTTFPGNICPERHPMNNSAISNHVKMTPNLTLMNSIRAPPPPPPFIQKIEACQPEYLDKRLFSQKISCAEESYGNKNCVLTSPPTVYASTPTNTNNVFDDTDILSILERTEHEMKNKNVLEKKVKDKKAVQNKNKTLSSISFKPSSVTASENLQNDSATLVKSRTKRKKTKSTINDTIQQKKGNKLISSSEATSSTSGTNLPGSVPSYDGIKAPAHASINDDTVKKIKKSKKIVRTGGGQIWEDPSLKEWDVNDFRIFCGDLGNDVTDEVLQRTFGRYPSFQKAKVIRDKKSNKTKGFGFVSFRDPADFTKAMREMNGKYVGSRPIKMRKSNWKDRNIEIVKQKQKTKQQMGYKW